MAKTSIRKEQGGIPKGGATDEVLKKASSTDYAVLWGVGGGSSGSGNGGTKLEIDTTQFTSSSQSFVDMYTVSIPGGVLGDNNAIRFNIITSSLSLDAGEGFHINVIYGGTTIISDLSINGDGGNSPVRIHGMIVANNASNAQKGVVQIEYMDADTDRELVAAYGTSAVDSSVAQDLVIQIRFDASGNEIVAEGVIVEKITDSNPVNVLNVYEFDDFTSSYVVPESGTGTDYCQASGNFIFGTGTAGNESSSVQDHPGIVDIKNNQLLGFNTGMTAVMTEAGGLLSFANDFDITYLLNYTFSGTGYNVTAELNGDSGVIRIVLDGSVGFVAYNVGAGQVVTAIALPVTDTWSKLRFVNVGGTLTLYLDETVVYTGALAFSDNFGVRAFTSGANLDTAGVDYVITNYTVNR